MSHRFFGRRDSKDKSNGNNNNNNKKDFSGRKAQLTPLEYKVTQERQTERPFSNKYNRFWEPGTYHCIVCNAELFKSNTKFESKSGWPAFSNVVDPKRIKLSTDLSHIGANLLLLITKPDLARTEVSCAICNAHLGHLFKDGPKPTGLRYCINSSSLHFVATSQGNPTTDYDDSCDANDTKAAEEFEEFPCNPYNSCGLPPPRDSGTDQQNTFRKSQTLPPMATLCLNNQSCQRLPSPAKTASTPKPKELSQSSDALDTPNPKPLVNANTVKTVSSSIVTNANTNKKSSENNNFESNNEKSRRSESPVNSGGADNYFQRTGSSRYPSSKGASLTAARINFFQNLTSTENKEKEVDPFTQWKKSLSSNPNSVRPFVNRFVNSASSGSLAAARNRANNNSSNGDDDEENKNDQQSKITKGFSNSTGGIEKISAAPTPLKETSL